MNKSRQKGRKTDNTSDRHDHTVENDDDVLSKFPDEIENLEKIKIRLKNALEQAEERVNQYDREYMESKLYLADYRHEIDPREICQNELLMKQIENSGIFAVQLREKLAKLVNSPYFARIDFTYDGDDNANVFYIGRFSFSDKSEILIYDWRAPISSMFYDYELGRAGYEAPMGRIEGELTRKRQFKISNGLMEYVLESAINIRDDVLQRELSHTSDKKMKTIIATIQREQNQIIRNEKAGTMVIQGVAGSGKTSIALHRVAYLLYRYKDDLSANNVVILSPNKVFVDYISNVLPELGEEPIGEMSFADIADIQLDKVINYEPDCDPIEINDSAWNERAKFKSTLDFVMMMDNYLEYAAKEYFVPSDYEFGRFKATRDWILTRYNAYQRHPIKKRLHRVSEDILEQFKIANIRGEELPKQKVIYRKLVSMLKFSNTLALYKDFFKVMNMPEKLVLHKKGVLEWPDVYPFMYFHAALEGLKENRLIRHLIIDEMQDYTPVQYTVINKLFPCNKTILGDFGQSINPNNIHALNDLRTIYPDAEFMELNKSYRSTFEIITFTKRIQNVLDLKAIERHGDVPKIITCCDLEDELTKIKEEIIRFFKNKFVTLGIILKTNQEAQSLFDVLSKEYDIQLLTLDSDKFTNGITITSVRMSKGLEFDEVLIPGANTKNYYTDFDRSLLYIACTRAMHRLTLTYTGDLTNLIEKNND
ncbi:AAA family ATPase [Iocasia frigidifontis]|uniref:AAA family ATPase n=1 Tax=Iocasia fonsfrigidae TaxID=2682810 RepID=A0A8A7KIA1_9FIRM|nr:3'-5' exonuclease [Iocasia fonsfrigidae]QTL97602.1 AAA family ATPase [Iocasia fonsfrigidae]